MHHYLGGQSSLDGRYETPLAFYSRLQACHRQRGALLVLGVKAVQIAFDNGCCVQMFWVCRSLLMRLVQGTKGTAAR